MISHSDHQRIIELMFQLAPLEGYNLTPLSDVRILRSDRPLKRTPVLYDPGIVIVCQGRKIGFWGSETYLYDTHHYLAVSVPVPFDMVTDASREEPLLAIYFHLNFKVVADLLLELDEIGTVSFAKPKGMYSSPMETALSHSILHFLEVMTSDTDSKILGPGLVREIYFRILTGQQGGTMRAALAKQGHFGKISKAVRKIHSCYSQALTIESLAKEASMSASTFHVHFKLVTNTSPMQYLKIIRLHQARLIMFRNGATSSMASAEVGYESPTQFNREFKRFFGRTPSEEVKRMISSFALPPPISTTFVSSH